MTAPTFASVATGVRGATHLVRPRGIATAALTLLGAVLLLLPAGAVLQVALSAQLDDRTPTQAIVVLDPGRYWGPADPVLLARLDHAATLYREGVAPVVMVTGPRRQADDQRRALMAAGVPGRDVVAFSTGRDTVGALQVVAGVMRDLGWSAATVVTDPAHAARAQATASGLGLDAHLSPTERGPGAALTSEYVGRETVALLRYHLITRWAISPVIRTS